MVNEILAGWIILGMAAAVVAFLYVTYEIGGM